jgi:uncharacterized protein (DUF58 family)
MDPQYSIYLLDGRLAAARYGLSIPRASFLDPAGSSLGLRAGASLEFMDHREYVPGDDLRRVDWNAFARTDRLTVKLYRSEVYPFADVIIDCTKSLALADTAKLPAALGLAALFCQAADNCGYMFAAWSAGEVVAKIDGGSGDPGLWRDIAFDSASSLGDSLRRTAGAFRPRSIRILISDLLWLGDPLETIALLSHNASALYIVQVLAREEIEPTQYGNLRLVDSETGAGEDAFIDPAAISRYKEALSRHQQNWSRAARSSGAILATLVAEDVTRSWQLDELVIKGMLKAI